MSGTDDEIETYESYDGDDNYAGEKILFLHCKNKVCVLSLRLANYSLGPSSSTPATAVRAISSIDLSALRIRKLESLTFVIFPITPPVVTTRSPIFSVEIVSCNCLCRFCCGLINRK